MTLLTILAAALALSFTAQAVEKPSAHTAGTPTGKPGEYWWNPKLSPSGPLMVLVSVPEQTMHVDRNGILIGRSTVSTGSKGHATPGGVFSILEKKEKHFSKKYNKAPMPNMQRLTWTGICMHSGNLPGYPASHGCIRLPFDFSHRNGNPIGRAPVEISGRGSLGNHVFSLLDGTTSRLSILVPGRAARRWTSVESSGRGVDAEQIASRLRMNPEFARKVYDTIAPGTTVIITDQPVVRSRRNAAIIEG